MKYMIKYNYDLEDDVMILRVSLHNYVLLMFTYICTSRNL